RIGEKPLYYTFVTGELIFSSELKGLLAAVNRRLPLDQPGLSHYFRFGYYPPTISPFSGVFKLGAACIARICGADIRMVLDKAESPPISVRKYWARPDFTDQELSGNAELQIDKLNDLLSRAVADQAVADVNVGVFLSGGIDSSVVTALLQAQSQTQINTYTVAFDNKEYNEAPFAADIARHIGTAHTEIHLSIDECFSVIQELPNLLDEPFADASLLPTSLICKEARKHVTVCLSGDGGDALFAGYNRYVWGDDISRMISKIPSPLRLMVSNSLELLSPRSYEFLASPLAALSRARGTKAEKDFGTKIYKLADALRANGDAELYTSLMSFWRRSPFIDGSNFDLSERVFEPTRF